MPSGHVGWIRAAAAAAAAASLATLWGVGVRSWFRTAGLRHGYGSGASASGRSSRSSPTTWLAAVTGLAASSWGVLGLRADGPLGAAVAAAGAGIAASGVRSRVTIVEASEDALVVHRAFRRPVELPWPDLRAVRVPATPLGGWRFRTDHRAITLMPSDLVRHEDVIAAAIDRAGLRFDGGRWARPP